MKTHATFPLPFPLFLLPVQVVAFLRQPNILEILRERHGAAACSRNLREKINAIRVEGTTALDRYSHDLELTILLRWVTVQFAQPCDPFAICHSVNIRPVPVHRQRPVLLNKMPIGGDNKVPNDRGCGMGLGGWLAHTH